MKQQYRIPVQQYYFAIHDKHNAKTRYGLLSHSQSALKSEPVYFLLYGVFRHVYAAMPYISGQIVAISCAQVDEIMIVHI